MEKFVGIIGCEDKYQISDKGRLKSLAKTWIAGFNTKRTKPDTIMAWSKDDFGYSIARIRVNGKNKMISLHRMLAIHFIANPDNRPCINHIDGNPGNNELANLEWSTYSENGLHAYRTGLNKKRFGEESHAGKPIIVTKKKTGEVIKFPTLTMAAKSLNLNIGTISGTLVGRKGSRDYIFEYFKV